ncbi:MAG TPA: glycosyltransferase, partial [Alphaproteobacteria bacterium]|nr:glycosyltransferase [Alphaproteobacteria bacterium]
MKILIAMQRIFDEVGGGQTFIRNAIERHPEHEFYYFDNRASRAGLPANARPLPISDQYRAAGGLGLAAVAAERPELSLEGRDHDVALLLDMAAAAANRRFDVVEIPDFMPFGALLPDLLRHHGATVDRVAHSLHGALTLSIRTLWQGANTSDLAPVEAYERLAYRSADIRYGISARYAGALAAEEGLPAVVVDPRLALAPGSLSLGADYLPAAPEEMARMPAARRRDGAPARRLLPDLNFVGRQDQIKGPDLFLSLAANIPADQYGAINLFGATVEIEGVSSAKVLSEMAARRGLRIAANRPMGHADVQRLFAEGRGITFVPSRVDTFNLVALESVLNGCPTVISTACGICDFLDEAYPGLPYVKLDPENIWPALAGIQEILDDYEGYRARIAAYLAGRPRPDYGTDLTAVYGGAPAGDAAAAAQVARAAAEIVRLLRTRILPERRATVTEEVRATLQGHAVGHGSADLGPYAPALLGGAEAIRALRAEGGRAFASADGMADAMRTLTAAIEGQRVDRINAFGLLAELERRRGNELLWAVYQLRRFRLSGHAPADRLREVRAVLDQHGLGAEAEAAALLHGGDEEAVYAHLKAQAALCTAPSAEGIELVEHHFRRENPRIAVLVSAYNCAPKVEQFVAGLRSFTPETLRAMEVVVVDSGSPDDTLGALRRALSRPCGDRTLDATIVRTARRETIQAAWNRALTIVRAPYITFLGADEMMRPDALAILAAELDRAPGLDWVQGNGLVCEVNEHGSPVRDVMTYDRRFDNQFMHYLDCCYMGYVGGLYRRAVHDRVGFYNPGFRAAGDNEFKNR